MREEPGSGVIIEPTSIWGNGVFAVSLSDFAAIPWSGACGCRR